MEWWGNQCKALGQVMARVLISFQDPFLEELLGKELRDDRSEKVVHPNHPDIGSVTSITKLVQVLGRKP